jgi:2,3-bisphosphoglycerate-dependent phosphoglycerate mutase
VTGYSAAVSAQSERRDERHPQRDEWPAIGHVGTLWLVRHGQSAGNVANDLAHANGTHQLELAERDMDVPLSPLGRRQADALGAWLHSLPSVPDAIWTSPYRRAADTATIALEAAGMDVPIVRDERLREREFGILDRLTREGIKARHPEQAAARAFLGKFFHRPPGGESWVDVAARVRSVLTDLRLDHAGQRIVVVAHQAVILLVRYVLEGLSEAAILDIDRQHEIANTAVTTYDGDGRVPPMLVSFNVVDHLPAELRTASPDVPVAPR